MMSIPVVTVIGRSGSGKTTLLERLVAEFKARGCRVAAIKHHSHAGFEIDVPGKDSWRFAQAGSDVVIIAAPDKIAQYEKLERALSIEEILPRIAGVDLILAEGYSQARLPSVEVVGSESKELISDPRQLIAVAADNRAQGLLDGLSVPRFSRDAVPEIANLIERTVLQA